MSTQPTVMQPSLPPTGRRVRAYFAPVDRTSGRPSQFDATQAQLFNPDAPPAPWVDLGWVSGFARASEGKLQGIVGGAPAAVVLQGRQTVGATVAIQFERWSKLTMSLSCGSLQTNVIAADASATPVSATGSTATFLATPSGAGTIQPGAIVAVDADWTGQTGYVGAGVAGAYRSSTAASDVNWIRRVTLNVGRVTQVTATGVQLAEPLLAGVPVDELKVQPVVAFQDREGGTFFQEWSGLFVMPGEQGDALFFFYPRLQAMTGVAESTVTVTGPLNQWLLAAKFQAMPVIDAMDGAQVCCYRTYLPCSNAQV